MIERINKCKSIDKLILQDYKIRKEGQVNLSGTIDIIN